MILTIWRHGQAGQAADDRVRELTPTGRQDVATGAKALAEICDRKSLPQPDAIWYSRWQRTAQTTEIIAATLGNVASHSEDALIPGASPEEVEQALDTIWDSASVPRHLILVSHQPLVSELADFFTGERGAIPHHPPGGLVTLSLDSPSAVGGGLLFWAFPPLFEAST